jgi:hypothetical protein
VRPLKKQDCKHNRIREKLKFQEKYGTHNVYCSQCQRWVDVMVIADPPRTRVPQDDD